MTSDVFSPENPEPRPALVLCGCDERAADWPYAGRVVAYEWSPEPVAVDGIFGLLEGRGDPRAGGLDEYEWAVVSVRDYVDYSVAGREAVRFCVGEVLYRGERPDALQFLLSQGLEAAGASIPTQAVGDEEMAHVGAFGLSEAGKWGVAWSGAFGWAKAGAHGVSVAGVRGFARAGDFGVSVADEAGVASAGRFGVSVSTGKRFGEARAGDNGVAVGLERYKVATAGQGGVAIADTGRAFAGDGGVAVSRRGRADVASAGLAVGEVVSGGDGLLVAQAWSEDGEIRHTAVGIVGVDGIKPQVRYRPRDGRLVQADIA